MRKSMAVIKSPTQIREEQARGLITLLESIKKVVVEDRDNLKVNIQRLNGALERFYTPFDTYRLAAQKLNRNISLLLSKKTNEIKGEPRCNVHYIAEDTTHLIDTVINEVKLIGIPNAKISDDHSVNVNVSQNQEQSQHQDVIVNILLDAIKDELTGRQRKEILEIAKNCETPEEARKSIYDKIKEFGGDVSANIVANILTNPSVWSTIGALI